MSLYDDQNRRCANCDKGCLKHDYECRASGQWHRKFCTVKYYDKVSDETIKIGVCKSCVEPIQKKLKNLESEN